MGNEDKIQRQWRGGLAAALALNLCLGACNLHITHVSNESSFNARLPFDAGTESSYAFDPTRISLSGGVCRLNAADQLDDDNTCGGFGDGIIPNCGGTFNGVTWDSTRGYVRLAPTGTAFNTAELDSSWAPKWSNIVGYWPMNNNWNDSKGSYNGTAFNGAGFTTGSKLGSHAGNFDGVDDYVDVGDVLGMNFGASSNSVSVWIKAPDVNQAGTIISKRNATIWSLGVAGNSSFTWPVGKQIVFLMYTTGIYRGLYTDSPVADGNWHHVVVVANSSSDTFAVYIDGVSVPFTLDANSGSWPLMNTSIGVEIGNGAGGSKYFNGNIDELAVWNTALTAAEVQTIYSRQSAKYSGSLTSRVMDAFAVGMSWTKLAWSPTLPFMKELPGGGNNETSTDYPALVGSTGATGANDLMSGIQGLWHLDEGSGTTVNDSSGNAFNGSIVAPAVLNNNGRFGGSVTLNTGFVDLGNHFAFAGTAAHTFSFWIKTTSNYFNLLAKRSGGAGTWEGWILWSSSGVMYFERELAGVQHSFTSVGTPINDGQWHMVTYNYDGAFMRFYIDGIFNASFADTTSILDSGANAEIDGAASTQVDELAIWSRALRPEEILQLYRRGANRIKHQVRICANNDCSDDPTGANWKGPDGTNQTYFSELNSNTAPLLGNGSVLKTPPSMLFSAFTSPVATSRYFQYRSILESDDSGTGCNYGSGATWCAPELRSVTVDPVHYDSTGASITGKNGMSLLSLTYFAETQGASCASGISYNLGMGASASSAIWYYWNGTSWALADGTVAQSSSAISIQSHASNFVASAHAGTVYVKAFLKSSGIASCELSEIALGGTH